MEKDYVVTVPLSMYDELKSCECALSVIVNMANKILQTAELKWNDDSRLAYLENDEKISELIVAIDYYAYQKRLEELQKEKKKNERKRKRI